ncbi:hypothetical protein LSS_22510 [Leptospira santarosai serovar Shermani str. LT 821]|uniref:Lipoprotein n=2 Tax=Leptospira santarosai TaxID=28183 RepID=A0A097ESU4_9LEPT|nr:hypothetical protein LSS_22510 [Leptospira santarosai serovar Shermani str. LT 821]AVV48706.1 Uncharacterized protein XB17_00081 [Leptospira santarosai]
MNRFKKIMPLIFMFLTSCFADSPRSNCRDELDMIEFERDLIMTLLISEVGKDRISEEQYAANRSSNFAYYYILNEKSLEKKRKCEGDFFMKLFSPETKDLK